MNDKYDKLESLHDYHNRNCFAYLKEISNTPTNLLSTLFNKDEFAELINLLNDENYLYNPDISYANLYSCFLLTLEENASDLKKYFEDIESYKKWFNLIYANPNDILFKTFELFKDKLAQRSLVDARPEKMVSTALDAFVDSKTTHMFTPKAMGSLIGRFIALCSSNFKPMITTSIPSIRNYNYTIQHPEYPQELRFGTQAQRHENEVRVSPLFNEWLRIHQNEDKIEHVYFNLLGADRTDFEGNKEKAMTQALADLEQQHDMIAVITLPADKGLMAAKDYQKNQNTIPAKNAFEEMIQIVLGTSTLPIKDFYVSDKIKSKLYEVGKEEDKVKELLEMSFKKMGVVPPYSDINLSKAQRQAIWFDFCKYVFPNFVLNTLQPRTWNASCKDAIDRGGVASSYLNLMRSFESPSPMSRDEFEQSLHAAAAVVKGRGLNHHYEIIWNAVNHYVDANFERLAGQPQQVWLIHWRNDNTPYSVAQSPDYLLKVVNQNLKLIELIPDQGNEITQQLKQKATDVIKTVKTELFHEDNAVKPVSGKRLFLEIVSKSTQLTYDPHDQNTRIRLNDALDELNQSSIFQPICKILVSFIDFLAKYFTAVHSMRGDFYSTLVRYADKRDAIEQIKQLSQDPPKLR